LASMPRLRGPWQRGVGKWYRSIASAWRVTELAGTRRRGRGRRPPLTALAAGAALPFAAEALGGGQGRAPPSRPWPRAVGECTKIRVPPRSTLSWSGPRPRLRASAKLLTFSLMCQYC